MILHTKYQGSRPCSFRQEDCFHVAPYMSLCETCDFRGGGGGQFWPKGYNLNTRGRGILGDATY